MQKCSAQSSADKLQLIGKVLAQCDTLYDAYKETTLFASSCAQNTDMLIYQFEKDTNLIKQQDSLLTSIHSTLRTKDRKLQRAKRRNKNYRYITITSSAIFFILGLLIN